ncbi:hypothetical protein ACE6H2_009972 [Prunus campanulata]
MEGSDEVLLSSTPTRRSVTQKPSASDENDQYYQQVGNSHLRSPKKPMTKNYMSPTISAASKAIASRNNILGERNETSEPNFSNTLVEKSPHIGTDNGNDSLSQALPLTPSVFQCHDDGNALSDSLSSRPYDPITNYLSPRPQFLRYNPNRRRERFLGLEYGGTERNEDLGISTSGSIDSQKAIDEEAGAVTTPSSLASPRQDGLLSRSGSFDSQKATDEEAGAVTTPSSFASPRQDDLLSISGSFDSQKAIDEEAGAVTTPSSLTSPRQDGLLKQGDEEVEVSDGEIEESDEESDEEYEEVKEEKKGWKLKGLLKSLLLLLVLVLFTSHISTMNHQTAFEGIQDDGYCSIQNRTLEAALLKKLESGGMLWDEKEETHLGLVEMGVEEGKVVEFESGSEVRGQGEEETQMDSMEEVLELKDEEIEAMEVTEQEENGVIDKLAEKQVEDIDETFDQMAENSDQMPSEVDHLNLVSDVPNDLEEEGEVAVGRTDGMVENKMKGGLEEYFTNMIAEPAMSETMDKDNLVSDVSNDLEEEGEVAVEQIDGMVENKMEGGLEEYFTNMIAEPAMSETMDNDDDAGFDEILKLEAEGNWREELINHMKSKTFYTAFVGVSIFSVIVASLVLAFRFKQRNGTKKGSSVIEDPCAERLIIEQKKINEKVSSLPLKPYSEPVIAEKYTPVLPNRVEDSSIEHVYSSFRRMSLSSNHSTEAASEENYHSQAPTVELLGEFVVGEVSRKITEIEESNYSVSSKKKLGSKVQSVSFQGHPIASEFSSMDSPSYGSYITPQKIMKKKEGGGKDEEVATPLRRSSRIRNRTVMSP